MQFDIPFHINGQGKKIKYRQVPNNIEDDLANVGSKVPADAIEYKTGDTFIAWFSQDIQVYVVDGNDNILDAYEINRTATNTFNTNTFEILNDKIIYKTVFAPNVKSEGVYFAHNNFFIMREANEIGNWTLDSTGISTIEISLPSNFIYDNSVYGQYGHLHVASNVGGYHAGHHFDIL